jgi:hypothetical protein
MASKITSLDIEHRILGILSRVSWLKETTICRSVSGKSLNPRTEDMLFRLVTSGLIEWFGDNLKPLKYRILAPGRSRLAKLSNKYRGADGK